MDGISPAKFRALPQLQRLLEQPEAVGLLARYPRPAVVASLRGALEAARRSIRAGGAAPSADELLGSAASALAAAPAGLGRVINATGVVLHTNLGRAPLAPEATDAIARAASGYCNLEFDLAAGARGPRAPAVERLLRDITGGRAALAVNNNAAAVLLALSGLAEGGEVIVSRGELIEIGGGFRIPEVIAQGGARLREVGTTNRTRLADYQAAIGPDTRVLLKVHASNFRISGFTEAVGTAALAKLAHANNLRVVEDFGSGALAGHPGDARSVRQAVQDGADIVAFSGDKLLGGPQSGLLVGDAEAIGVLRGHPLLRALRPCKLTLAALEATLRLHAEGRLPPALRMLQQSTAQIHERAKTLAAQLGATICASEGRAGGGTLPETPFPSFSVVLRSPDGPDATLARLRRHWPPIIARAHDGCVWLDMLAVSDDDLPDIVAAFA